MERPERTAVLKEARDADQRAEYHLQKALEWTRRAWRLREEVRDCLAEANWSKTG